MSTSLQSTNPVSLTLEIFPEGSEASTCAVCVLLPLTDGQYFVYVNESSVR